MMFSYIAMGSPSDGRRLSSQLPSAGWGEKTIHLMAVMYNMIYKTLSSRKEPVRFGPVLDFSEINRFGSVREI